MQLRWRKIRPDLPTLPDLFFGVCYRPPGQNELDKSSFIDCVESHLEIITNLCGNSKQLILTGDFNDRTTSWHSTHDNSELGLDLYNLINALSLHQLINEPTRNENLLDLLITNNPHHILNSGVLDPIHDLDHCPIFGKLSTHIKYSKPYMREIWDYQAGDYEQLNDQLTQIPWGMVTGQCEDIDDCVDILTDLITQCSKNCIPNKTVKICPRDKPGMTFHVKQLFKSSRRLHKRAQRTRNIHDLDLYKHARQLARQEWKQAHDLYYTKLVNKLHNSENNSRTYWKVMKHALATNKTVSIP